MTKASCSDAEFIELFETIGGSGTSVKLGIGLRNVFLRRERLEKKVGRQIRAPLRERDRRATRLGDRHPERIILSVDNGHILVGGDAHIWPGPPSLMMRAFANFAKELRPKALILNGDALDLGQISRHPPIGWEKTPTVQQEIEAGQEQLYGIERSVPRGSDLIWNLGNHDCLDTKTECLTRRGWKKHDELAQSDQILSWDDGRAVWSSIDEIVRFPYSGDMIRVEKTRASFAVTPNHRVLLSRLNWRSKNYDIIEYRRADDLPSSFNMPTAAQSEAPGIALKDDMIALIGWILTDGCFQRCNISIAQSKPDGIAKIEGILERLGFTYSRYDRQRAVKVICGRTLLKEPLPSSEFLIHAEWVPEIKKWLPDRHAVPEWIFDLNRRQFQLFLDTVIEGDGVWDGNVERRTCCVIYKTEPILSGLQAAAVCHGWRARLAIDNRGDPRLCLAKEPKLRIEKPEIYREHYEGTVWCLRVPHGNFMVRRNGCAFFTGNSRFETRIATVAPELAGITGVHLKDHFPAWTPAWSTWVNNNVVIKHRFKGGIHAVHNNTLWSGKSIITNHLHSAKVTPFTDYNGTRWGVDAGCIADTDAFAFVDYTEDNPKNWREALCVLTFKDGRLMQPELVLKWDDEHVQFRGEVIGV